MTIAISLFSHKKLILIGGLILSALLVGLYIFQLNYLTTLAYHIAEQEEELLQSKYRTSALQAEAFQSFSLKDLEQLASESNFEKIDKVTYLKVSAGPVAQQ